MSSYKFISSKRRILIPLALAFAISGCADLSEITDQADADTVNADYPELQQTAQLQNQANQAPRSSDETLAAAEAKAQALKNRAAALRKKTIN